MAVRARRDRGARLERDRGLPVQGPRRRAAVPRDAEVRVHLDRRLLPFAARRPAAAIHRQRAEVQRAMGFANEKDHPEVAPSQFEMNYSYTEAQHRRRPGAALQADLPPGRAESGHDRLVPAEAGHRRQRQRHAHEHVAREGRQEPLLGRGRARRACRRSAGRSSTGILTSANDICLILNSSVNAYRRLDPHFEAPNQIKASAIDRGAMVRIPLGNEKSARIEVRSIAPDANPYLAIYALLKTGLEGPLPKETDKDTGSAHPLPARQHLRRDPALQGQPVRGRADRRIGAGEVRRGEAGVGRPLPEGARRADQAHGGPVPPRGHEPVPLEPVLTRPLRPRSISR